MNLSKFLYSVTKTDLHIIEETLVSSKSKGIEEQSTFPGTDSIEASADGFVIATDRQDAETQLRKYYKSKFF